MKKYLTIFFFVSSLLIILGSFNFGYGLAMFFFAGIIPLINVQLTPEQMLMLYVFVIGLIIIYQKPRFLTRTNLLITKQSRSKPRKLKRV